MNVLLDTNILGRIVERGHAQHQLAQDAVDALIARGDDPQLVPQVLYEFYVIATRPTANNGLGLSAAAAAAELSHMQTVFPLLPDTAAIFPVWQRLVSTHAVLGKPAHDARLVAAMMVHGLTHILTFNRGDFARFSGITAITPSDLLNSPVP